MTNPENNLRDYSANLARSEPEHFTVPDEYAGLRLDQALVRFFPEYSRSRLQEWITQQQVKVDGAYATSKQKVWGGEKLEVLPQSHPAEQPYRAEDIALEILYEDDALLVINKPAGLVVHPGSGNWEGTLLNALLHHAPQLEDVPRAGIVAKAGQGHQRLAGGRQNHRRANRTGAATGGTQRAARISGAGAWRGDQSR